MKARPTADSDVRRWDDYHRDPVNDIVIKSSDNVHFRASSYRLSQIRYVGLIYMSCYCTQEG